MIKYDIFLGYLFADFFTHLHLYLLGVAKKLAFYVGLSNTKPVISLPPEIKVHPLATNGVGVNSLISHARGYGLDFRIWHTYS